MNIFLFSGIKKTSKFIVKPCPCTKNKEISIRYQSYFGTDGGMKYLKEININRTRKFTNTKRYWENQGFSKEDIKSEIKKVQKERSNINQIRLSNLPKDKRTCRQYGYWMDKGYAEEESKEKVKQIQISNGYEYYKEKYNNSGIDIQRNRNKKWLETLYKNNDMNIINAKKSFTSEKYIEKYGIDKFSIKEKSRIKKILETKYRKKIFSRKNSEKDLYLKKVRSYTQISKKYYMKKINPINKPISYNTNHIDHNYSISKGYMNNIPAHIIGSPVNLRVLNSYKNIKKGSKCDIDIFELLCLYHQFINEDSRYLKLIGKYYEN